MDEKKINPKIR